MTTADAEDLVGMPDDRKWCHACGEHHLYPAITAVDKLIREELAAARATVARLEAELAERGRSSAPPRTGRCGCTPAYRPARLGDLHVCTLPAGHQGWHHDEQVGAEWGQTWSEAPDA